MNRTRRISTILGLALSLALVASGAQAAIQTVSGSLVEIAPPPSVVLGALENNDQVVAFTEREGHTLANAVEADITEPGTYALTSQLTPATIPAGTRVDSHFIHADPVGTSARSFIGSITFESDIIGVMVQTSSLDDSDSLGAAGTAYPTGDDRRKIELNEASINRDVIVGPDHRTLIMNLRNSTGLDQMRVLTGANSAPDCSDAAASKGLIWPPNHKLVRVTVQGVDDPDGDQVTTTITAIRQDEPVNGLGDGNTAPDATGTGTGEARVRAERTGSPKVPGNGRFYHISFSASDGQGGTCEGVVLTAVPHDRVKSPVDEGPLYDSTAN